MLFVVENRLLTNRADTTDQTKTTSISPELTNLVQTLHLLTSRLEVLNVDAVEYSCLKAIALFKPGNLCKHIIPVVKHLNPFMQGLK